MSLFLLDAAGVLYTDSGPTPGAAEHLKYLQKYGDVFLLTNNSYYNIAKIRRLLLEKEMDIPIENIYSSGLGLTLDTGLQNMLSGKAVYVYGSQSSLTYLEGCTAKSRVDNPEQSDVIVLTSTLSHHAKQHEERLLSFLSRNPEHPLICVNPDRYVRGKKELYPVIGLLAERIENLTQYPVYWFGKPFKNYAEMVKVLLNKRGYMLNTDSIFMDDNLENVMAMKCFLGIQGVWVRESGIQSQQPMDTFVSKWGSPDRCIPYFSHFIL